MYQTLSPEVCAHKVAAAKHIVALTGAGLSTAAGVPDFRGPQGLYTSRRYDPDTVFDIHYFHRNPEPFYRFTREFLEILVNLQPTATHSFLADLESMGKSVTVVTQNIDGLHQRAGSTRILPMHGDYTTAHCCRCGTGMAGTELAERLAHDPEVPHCRCGGVLKPDVVFFGEPVRHLDEAVQESKSCDLMLALGSSLTVYPAASLPLVAGGEVAVVNRGAIGLAPGPRIFRADADLDEFFSVVGQWLK